MRIPSAVELDGVRLTDEEQYEATRKALMSQNNKKKRDRDVAELDRQYRRWKANQEAMEKKLDLIRNPERFIESAVSMCELAMLCTSIDYVICHLDDVEGFSFAKGHKTVRASVNKLKRAVEEVLNVWLREMSTDDRFMLSAGKGYELEPFIHDIVGFCMDDSDKWRFEELKKKMNELITPEARKARIEETAARAKILYPDAFPDVKYDPEVREASKRAWEYLQQ